MPIFVRRKLQLMIDEIAPYLVRAKGVDLLKRVEHQDPNQSLPAEYELALAWGVSKVADLEIERKFGTRAPDIYSTDLLSGGPAAIEVTAVSNDALGDESVMRRAANIINAKAAQFAKDAAQHLHYQFLEESGTLSANRDSWPFTRFYRRRRVTRKFQVSEEFEKALAVWLRRVPPAAPLNWADEQIAVLIKWEDYVHPHGNTSSSMPPVAYDVRDNPLYKALKAKTRQLKDVPSGVLKGIFVGDAGCSLLRDLGRAGGGTREIRGEEILRTFVRRQDVDFVVAFVPRRVNEYAMWDFDNPRIWHTHIFTNRLTEAQFTKVKDLTQLLPSPYLHGYQARSWHQQRMFDPQGRGHYLPPKLTSGWGKMSVQISARGLQEFLAGRIGREQFARWVSGELNLFETQLASGKTIASVSLERSGSEEDDDYVVFEFAEDPAALPLTLPVSES
jgi:hypothetical protein